MSHALPEFPHMSRHALAAAMELAQLPEGERIRSRDLAERIDVPAPILAKVLRMLAVAGVVEGVKGHYGGYCLARPPSEVRLIEVVSAVTGDSPDAVHPQCALGVRKCNPTNPCALHEEWARAIAPIQRLLTRCSLADVLDGTCRRSR